MQLQPSGIRLFRLFGVDVSLHWTWILVALYEIQNGAGRYSTIAWNVLEYLSLFGIVLMHEFGHALACRSVGGRADRIMLWPLGGVAFVQPPPRPGAFLWSIAAGPLVNVLLVPVTMAMMFFSGALASYISSSPFTTDFQSFTFMLALINLLLLIFNILPIYPLDGGQMLRSILWFFIGPARSLMVASIIGMAGAVAILGYALYQRNTWMMIMAAFVAMQSWSAFQQAKLMRTTVEAPRRSDAHCPNCAASPPMAPLWKCQCGESFDVFEHRGQCPRCGASAAAVACPNCGRPSPPAWWYRPTPLPPMAPGPVV